MDGDNDISNNATPQMGSAAAAAESQVLQVSEAVEMSVGVDGKLSCVAGGDDNRGGAAVGGEAEFRAKRKRGRPKKHAAVEGLRDIVAAAAAEPSASPQKRGRGRPKGTGKWQTLAASFGGTAVDSAGSNFTPHAIAIQTGENIVQRICSFSQRASESICILSACGTVSTAEILRPGSSGGILRYEGRFEIVSLTGSRSNNGTGGVHGKICLLSVQLANPDGALFGGAVAGSLIAGGPTQLVIGSFRQKSREQLKMRHCIEPSEANRGAVGGAALQLQQMVNGKLPDSPAPQANSTGLATVVPPIAAAPSSPRVDDGVDKVINEPDVNYASSNQQSFDWNSFKSSSSSVQISQHVISDVNTGVNDQ